MLRNTLSLLVGLPALAVAAAQSPADQATAACAAMNLTAKLGMMRVSLTLIRARAVACRVSDHPVHPPSIPSPVTKGYGTVKAYPGYSRNSGCGGACGRPSSTNAAGDVTAGTFRWDNGPQGFGDHTIPGSTTQWPSTLNMGSTFDPALAAEWGDAMGQEFYDKGSNIQEGPVILGLCGIGV